MTNKIGDLWYRYTDEMYDGGLIRIRLNTYPVIRVTPHGVWLVVPSRTRAPRKWVNVSASYAWAARTQDVAMRDFKARKRRQIEIIRSQLRRAEAALAAAASPTLEADAYPRIVPN